MKRLEGFKDIMADFQKEYSVPVSHYDTLKKSARYIVWQEMDQEKLPTNNIGSEFAWIVSIDLYTKTEFDEILNALQNYLDGIEQISWEYYSNQYESDTGYIHHEWYVTIYG